MTTLTSLPNIIRPLDELCLRLSPLIRRREVRQRLRQYVLGLLDHIERKNGWQLAEAMGERHPRGVQRLLDQATWDTDGVRDLLQSYVVEQLGDDGVLIVDETGFLKKGTKSAGVMRQYSGTAGRTENQQVGVFLAYATQRGCALIDRALYLPEEWAQDPERRREAHIPEAITFATKPQLAQQMLAHVFTSPLPVRWVIADTLYGHDELRGWLETQGQPYVLATPSTTLLWVQGASLTVAAIASRPDLIWVQLSAGEGCQGPRWYEWAWCQLPYSARDGMTQWLLLRRSLTDVTDVAYYRVCGPATTDLREMVRIAGMRWHIEQAFEETKGEVGLDQYEVRHWPAWYRHMTLVMLAYSIVVVAHARTGSQKGGYIFP